MKNSLKPGKLYRNIKPIMIESRISNRVAQASMIGRLNQVFMAVDDVNKILYKGKIVIIAFQYDIDSGIEEITNKKEYMEKVLKEIERVYSLSA